MTFYNGAETKFSEVQSRQKSNAVREKREKNKYDIWWFEVQDGFDCINTI